MCGCFLFAGTAYEGSVGLIRVKELDWTNKAHCSALDPPFDFVLAADCVYHENHLHDLLATILALTNAKSTGAIMDLERSCQSTSKS